MLLRDDDSMHSGAPSSTMVMESDLWDSPVGRDEILPALRLSYHDLPPHLKQCFAFCAIFSRGCVISKDYLIDIWMANEFIPSDDKGIESEFGGEAVFNDLEQRCFFQITSTTDVSSDIFFKMQDLIHDLSKSIMGSKCSYLNKWEDNSTRKIRHMIIGPEYVLPVSTNFLSSLEDKRTPFGTCETMRTLLINNTEWRSSIPPNINYLRALRLEHCEMSVFSFSICKLRHLRYLDLSDNKFETLPESISMLLNLQTFDLRRCRELRRLPNSLRLMKSLMHLYLDDCDNLEYMPSRMGVLKRLRKVTRYVVGSEVGSGRIIDLKQWNLHDRLKLVGLENVRSTSDAEEVRFGSKENLPVLDLEWGEGSTGGIIDEEVLQALQPHQNLKILTINSYRGKKMPTWLLEDSMLKNLVELYLAGLWRFEHLPQVGQLPSLQVLQISGMYSVKQVGGGEFYGTISSVVFPSLQLIGLVDMMALEEWSAVEGRSLFPKVTMVMIVGCPKLKTMPTFPSAQKLVIVDCPLLSPARDSFACMRSLETLYMGGECEKLIMMLEQEEEVLLDSVSYLAIPELQLTSSSQLWKRFPSLLWLDIRLCSGLEGFHPEGLLGLTALQQLFLIDNPQLAVLPELPNPLRL